MKLLTAGLCFVCLPLYAQSTPKFEVASIKPSPDTASVLAAGGIPHTARIMTDARVDLGNIPLLYLIATAYGLRTDQIVGPGWMSSADFDILANLPKGATKEEIPEMLQSLLADRFGLKVHRLTPEKPVYALVVGSKGSILKESVAYDPNRSPSEKDSFIETTGKDGNKPRTTYAGGFGRFKMTLANGFVHYEYESMTSKDLAQFLNQNLVDLPVVDMTGLRGSYEVQLDISASDIPHDRVGSPDQGDADHPATASDPSGNSVFSSIEKLGLKLERRKAGVETLVIDHVDKLPTEN
jgi:uncharacterized protein (TIGR03435 family)